MKRQLPILMARCIAANWQSPGQNRQYPAHGASRRQCLATWRKRRLGVLARPT
ncbi:hypothetical protein [Cupriavidus sp. H19C3]|uniref:hypothetical protein n=1 Tax=Cupriavidus sp. H19C3 TaxID=3241603 RepID=UPI003BF7E0EE